MEKRTFVKVCFFYAVIFLARLEILYERVTYDHWLNVSPFPRVIIIAVSLLYACSPYKSA